MYVLFIVPVLAVLVLVVLLVVLLAVVLVVQGSSRVVVIVVVASRVSHSLYIRFSISCSYKCVDWCLLFGIHTVCTFSFLSVVLFSNRICVRYIVGKESDLLCGCSASSSSSSSSSLLLLLY